MQRQTFLVTAINLVTEQAKLEETKHTINLNACLKNTGFDKKNFFKIIGKPTEEKEIKEEMWTRQILKLEFFCINCIQIIKL